MKTIRKMLLILAALAVLLPASAEAATEKYRAYTMSAKGAIAYSEPNMVTGKVKYIVGGNYEARILSFNSNFVTLLVNGSKVYTPTGMFLLKSSGWKTMYASDQIAAYRRKSTEDRYGSVAQFDKVRVIGRSGNYTQVVYPAAGNKYGKIAWIATASEKKLLTPPPTGIRRKKNSSLTVKKGTRTKISYLVEVLPKDKALQAVEVIIAKNSVMERSGQYLVALKKGKTKVTFKTLNGYSCSYTFTVKGA